MALSYLGIIYDLAQSYLSRYLKVNVLYGPVFYLKGTIGPSIVNK